MLESTILCGILYKYDFDGDELCLKYEAKLRHQVNLRMGRRHFCRGLLLAIVLGPSAWALTEPNVAEEQMLLRIVALRRVVGLDATTDGLRRTLYLHDALSRARLVVEPKIAAVKVARRVTKPRTIPAPAQLAQPPVSARQHARTPSRKPVSVTRPSLLPVVPHAPTLVLVDSRSSKLPSPAVLHTQQDRRWTHPSVMPVPTAIRELQFPATAIGHHARSEFRHAAYREWQVQPPRKPRMSSVTVTNTPPKVMSKEYRFAPGLFVEELDIMPSVMLGERLIKPISTTFASVVHHTGLKVPSRPVAKLALPRPQPRSSAPPALEVRQSLAKTPVRSELLLPKPYPYSHVGFVSALPNVRLPVARKAVGLAVPSAVLLQASPAKLVASSQRRAPVLVRVADDVFEDSGAHRKGKAINDMAWKLLQQEVGRLERDQKVDKAKALARRAIGTLDAEQARDAVGLLARIYAQSAADEVSGLEQFVREFPNPHPLRSFAAYKAARYAYQVGQYEYATTVLTGFTERFPHHTDRVDVLLTLALCQVRGGAKGAGLATLERLCSLDVPPEKAAQARFLIAWLHLSAQRNDKATEMLNVIVKAYPDTKYGIKANELLSSLMMSK